MALVIIIHFLYSGDFYADAVPFVDRSPPHIPEMEDPRPLPVADVQLPQGDIQVTYRILAGASQKGKVLHYYPDIVT